MKPQKYKVDVERSRSRAHRILFDDDLPFKGVRVEASRVRYQRRVKHVRRQFEDLV